jgi:hypothetical protein
MAEGEQLVTPDVGGAIHRNTPVWHDRAWEPLPMLHRDAAADWCVVGLKSQSLRKLAMTGGR